MFNYYESLVVQCYNLQNNRNANTHVQIEIFFSKNMLYQNTLQLN